ncbi:MAG: DNA photolyase [Candidatus Marinimicrobia bacterium]|nr:DNA photolyase [Candidatus Neomarinimicrobiota bacterium]
MDINKTIKKIYISKSSSGSEVTNLILQDHPTAEKIYLENDTLPEFFENPKQVLWLTQSKGEIVKGCPGTNKSYLCCRYQVINHTLNCPLNCTYCILQFYLNQPATIIYTNYDDIIHELKKKLNSQPNRFIRIGTGELGDSLALKGSRLFAGKVIELFSEIPNAFFEIKSKLTITDDLLNIPHKGNIVFSWSINPQEIVNREESMADPITLRLQKAKQAQDKGFLTGFHFDPILNYENWQEIYGSVIDQLYSTVDPNKIPWISLGSLRFPPSMKEKIIDRYPDTQIPYGEMIKGMDGKMRYARPVRVPIYQFIYNKLTSISNPPFIYFCMESPLVWQEVMGFAPKSNDHLDWMFADSIFKRFNLKSDPPELENYRDALNLDNTEF